MTSGHVFEGVSLMHELMLELHSRRIDMYLACGIDTTNIPVYYTMVFEYRMEPAPVKSLATRTRKDPNTVRRILRRLNKLEWAYQGDGGWLLAPDAARFYVETETQISEIIMGERNGLTSDLIARLEDRQQRYCKAGLKCLPIDTVALRTASYPQPFAMRKYRPLNLDDRDLFDV